MNEGKLALVTPEVLVPILALEEAVQRRLDFKQYVSKLLEEDLDYGNVGQGKPALKKPGAEKLATFFGLTVSLSLTTQIYDWTGKDSGGQPLFAFTYHCVVARGDVILAEADGHCNSWESRYRWRWLDPSALPRGYDTSQLFRRESMIEEFEFAIKKKQTEGQYGKPAEYWAQFESALASGSAKHSTKKTSDGRSYPSVQIPSMVFRVPNPDPYDAVNSCLKIAHKRAYVAGVLIATNASDYFTQDLDDDPSVAVPQPPREPQRPAAARTPSDAAGQTVDVKSAAQPEPEPEGETPEELARIYRVFAEGTRDDRLGEFAKKKQELRDLHGDGPGEKLYSEILGRFGVEHASQFTGMASAKRAMAALYEAVVAGADVSEPQTEEEPVS